MRLFDVWNLTIIACAASVTVACGKKEPPPQKTETAAPEKTEAAAQPEGASEAKVVAYSGQGISRFGPVKIAFDRPVVDEAAVGEKLDPHPFTFDPALEGTARWLSRTELAFVPKDELPAGLKLKATVAVAAVTGNAAAEPLAFELWPVQRDFEVTWLGWRSTDDKPVYTAEINTRDQEPPEVVESMLSAEKAGDTITTDWSHSDDGRYHRVSIGGVERAATPGALKLTVSGQALGVDRTDDTVVAVPAENAFIAVSARLGDNDSIEIRFSDPLQQRQSFASYVEASGQSSLRFSVERDLLRVFAASGTWSSEVEVTLKPGLASSRRKKLKEAQRFVVKAASRKPVVNFLGQGVIVPTKGEVVIPIETANLTHIRVEALQVPSSNLGQFLQVNDFDEHNELTRVGRVVWSKRVDLEARPSDRSRIVRRGLDLTELTKQDPTGLYRIRLSFLPSDTDVECPRSAFADFDEAAFLAKQAKLDEEGAEASYWDYYGDGNGYGDNYRNRKNPCHLAYYKKYDDHDIRVSRNVLFSNVGIIAKAGSDNQVLVVTTTLDGVSPIVGADVVVRDYQHQALGRATTNKDGFARVRFDEGQPFSVFVTHDEQTSALRLKDGQSLSVAHFDATGAPVNQGLKGFIYGERGVWRPGDTLHLGFILQDEAGTLPAEHPVIFTLRNPRGQLVTRETRTAEGRIHRFDIPTTRDAPTGDYVAEVEVGAVRFTKKLSVETVVPNRLRIDFDFKTELLKGPSAEIDATLAARWLHGAIAKRLRTTVEVSMSPTRTKFAKYDDFRFDDPARKFTSSTDELFAGKLDNEGQVQVKAELSADGQAPGMLMAHFTTRVFEPSGQPSVDRHSIRFSPYARYIGVKTPKGDKARGMLLTDTKHVAEIVAVDADGNPVDAEVTAALYKIRWRWWWEKGSETSVDFNEGRSRAVVKKTKVKLRNGRGKFPFEVKYPEWGRYLLVVSDDDGGHRAGKVLYIDWPGWAGRAQKGGTGSAHRLTLVSDRPKVKVGESFTLSFPSPPDGRALLTLETGTRVLSEQWVPLNGKDKTTQISIEATPEMTPSVYAHVTLLQPHSKRGNDRPMRLYGVTPVKVVDEDTVLEPVVEAPPSVEPDGSFEVAVRETKGRPMTYTLAMVDEGLLGLTRFKTPNPWAHFFRREALGVKTWDLFDHVAGGYGGKLETLLAIGGDGAGEDDIPTSKAQRFKPVVAMMGPFTLAAGEKKTHKIDMPAYLGEVRLMVVAAGDRAFGRGETSVRVAKPVMLLSSVPKVLSPQEQLKLPVTVFVLEEGIRQARIELAATGPVFLDDASRTQTVSFDGPGEKTLQFPISTAARAGVSKLTFKIKAGRHTFSETTEVAVRYPNPPEAEVLSKTLQAGEAWTPKIELVGIKGTNSFDIELSRVRPLNLTQHIDWLVRYPHGCLEQTISTAFPQMYLSQIVDLTPTEEERVRDHIRAAIGKLSSFQQDSGGFGYWPSESAIHDYSTSWTGHFMLEAKQAGFVVSADLLGPWLRYQKDAARRWVAQPSQRRADLVQAYRLYTLALAKQPEIAAMNRLRESGKLSGEARLRLAAAYALTGDTKNARRLASDKPAFDAERELTGTFGTPLRDKAMAAETYLLLDAADEYLPLIIELSDELGKTGRLNTHELSFALITLARYAAKTPAKGSALDVQVVFQGAERTMNLTKAVAKRALKFDRDRAPKLEVTNKTEVPVYATLVQRGRPDIGKIKIPKKKRSKVLELTADYTMNNSPVDPSALEEGTDAIVTVSVRNLSGRKLDELVLTHLIPTGWDLRNDRLDGRRLARSPFDYQDIRDDRLFTYFDLAPGETKTLQVRIHAQYPGRYYLPPIRVEAMYDQSISAQTGADWVEVRVPGQSS